LCHTTQQRAAPTIFPLNLQTITIIGCCLAEGREADIYGAETPHPEIRYVKYFSINVNTMWSQTL